MVWFERSNQIILCLCAYFASLRLCGSKYLMPYPAFGAIPHLLRWMYFWLSLMPIIKEIGILRLGQFFQFLLVILSRLLYTFIKLILSRMSHFYLLKLVGFRPVRGKNAFPVYRFLGFFCLWRPGQRARKFAG